MGIFFKPLERHGTSGRGPEQALPLGTPMRRNLGVGVQRKPVDTGTAGSREFRAFPFIPKSRADAAHFLPGAFPKGDTLLDRGRYGASEFRCVVEQRVIPGGHSGMLGGSTLRKRGLRPWSVRSTKTPSMTIT